MFPCSSGHQSEFLQRLEKFLDSCVFFILVSFHSTFDFWQPIDHNQAGAPPAPTPDPLVLTGVQPFADSCEAFIARISWLWFWTPVGSAGTMVGENQ